MYPKYSKHWPYLTMNCGCSKILNCGIFLSLFKLCGWKYILHTYWIGNLGLNSRLLYCLGFRFYLIYKPICQKLAQYLFAQTARLTSVLLMFILYLGFITLAATWPVQNTVISQRNFPRPLGIFKEVSRLLQTSPLDRHILLDQSGCSCLFHSLTNTILCLISI